jgi:hypothetical protein
VLEDWVFVHSICHFEDNSVDLFETAERVNWTSISFGGLEEIFSSGVLSLIRVLSWTTPSSPRGWRIPKLSIRTLGMLLLHMSVKCGIREICFVAVLAFEVSASVIVL